MDGAWRSGLTCMMTFKLKALSGCSIHHLQGVRAYCGGNNTGQAACLFCNQHSQKRISISVYVNSLMMSTFCIYKLPSTYSVQCRKASILVKRSAQIIYKPTLSLTTLNQSAIYSCVNNCL